MKKASPPSRSGRFTTGPAADVSRFAESVSFDRRLWRQDLRGSLAHARMLRRVGILTAAEEKSIRHHLLAISRDLESGRFRWRPELEDVHMNIEAELTRRTVAGAKLHTGRSRNDQVALDLRLWVLDETTELQKAIRGLQSALVDLADRYPQVLIPGYTHLQRAQPVYLAHHLLAYVEMLDRDHERLTDAARRTRVCPLGSGALAGSTLPLDRHFVALELGFTDSRGHPCLSQNSMDAVSDRDFAVEFSSIAALLAVHLSRIAEDLILWATTEFGFIRIDDAYTTGSSLMPQKKNPDVAELIRGKAGRVFGNLVNLLTLLKGLPLAYNRDLQQDKLPVFDSADTVRASLDVLAAMIRHTRIRSEACRQAVSDPLLLATDLAEDLVRKGVPFREAHHVVGLVVAAAEKSGKALDALSLTELRAIDHRFDRRSLTTLSLNRAMSRRKLTGSPGTREVRRQLARWHRRLAGG